MENMILKHMDVVRGITISILEKTTEEAADITPKGFNNNIRWNLGHIAFIQEKLVFGLAGEPMQTPESYESFLAQEQNLPIGRRLLLLLKKLRMC